MIKALEGFEFDGMGNGPTEYRAADHQCFKDVLWCGARRSPANQFDLLRGREGRAAQGRSTYDPTIFGGELGPDTAVACEPS